MNARQKRAMIAEGVAGIWYLRYHPSVRRLIRALLAERKIRRA